MKMHENRNNSNMESFYEENGQQFVATTQSSTQRASGNMKRPISLDLNLATNNNKPPGNKKLRCNQSAIPPTILNSPDLKMLQWGTPDLEKYILSSDPMQTPTPSLLGGQFTNPINANKVCTEIDIFSILTFRLCVFSFVFLSNWPLKLSVIWLSDLNHSLLHFRM